MLYHRGGGILHTVAEILTCEWGGGGGGQAFLSQVCYCMHDIQQWS